MKTTTKITIVLVFFILMVPLAFSCNSAEISEDGQNIRVIKIAQYPRYAGCDQLFDLIFNYTWKADDKLYKFTCTELTLKEVRGGGERPLNIENFDILAVGATFTGWTKDGLDPRIAKNVKEFLSHGGGYLSSCGGTIFSTQGYKNPKNLFEKRVNKCVLKIADVYINLNLDGEDQYIRKCGELTTANQGLIPIENRVVRNNANPIFALYPMNTVNMSYGGGPGLYCANAGDPNLGEITPLLVINEELMDTKPIHWYIKGLLPGWIPFKTVKTDMFGQYGAIATTYGNGKVVVFNAHPEIRLILNGTIKEYIGRSTGFGVRFPPFRVVFSWTGTPMNMSYNWWIHRRAAAWIAGVPDDDLPPCNELTVFMDKPQFRFAHKLYVNNHIDDSKAAKKRVAEAGMTIIQGNITVEAYAENSDIVEFYLDGVLGYTDFTSPFTWDLDKGLNGVHRLELRSYDEYGNCAYDGSGFLFYNT